MMTRGAADRHRRVGFAYLGGQMGDLGDAGPGALIQAPRATIGA
jgi:hypothetical protein